MRAVCRSLELMQCFLDEDRSSMSLLLDQGILVPLQTVVNIYAATSAAEGSDWEDDHVSAGNVVPRESGVVHAIDCLDVSSQSSLANSVATSALNVRIDCLVLNPRWSCLSHAGPKLGGNVQRGSIELI